MHTCMRVYAFTTSRRKSPVLRAKPSPFGQWRITFRCITDTFVGTHLLVPFLEPVGVRGKHKFPFVSLGHFTSRLVLFRSLSNLSRRSFSLLPGDGAV